LYGFPLLKSRSGIHAVTEQVALVIIFDTETVVLVPAENADAANRGGAQSGFAVKTFHVRPHLVCNRVSFIETDSRGPSPFAMLG
jgi:hypothetical protein